MKTLTVVDSGGANLGSVMAALQREGIAAELTLDPKRIRQASRVLLPGVGAAGPIAANLRQSGVDEALRALTAPLLGICVGMQVLFDASDEGDVDCLGLLPGRVTRLQEIPNCRVPHMGWNQLRLIRESPLLADIPDGEYAYFVHSFAVIDSPYAVADCGHGANIAALVTKDNFAGAQFHPERSARTGASLIRNFMRWSP